MDQYEALKKYFGYTSFREGQELLIRAILDGSDVLGIMPTGGGKSLCYQIPAHLMKQKRNGQGGLLKSTVQRKGAEDG